MTTPSDDGRAFGALLGLTQTEATENITRFAAPASPERGGRMFGGQFLGQGVTAAQLTCDAGRRVHSLHAYFLRPGNVGETLEIEAEHIRDGRSFSARQVRAFQGGKELFRMHVSLAVPAEGPTYDGRSMADVPAPDAVTYTYNDFNRDQGREGQQWDGWERPIDIRYINPPGEPGTPITEAQLMWMRMTDALDDRQATHDAALAYLSDSTLIDHVLLPHGRRYQEPNFDGASLDHTMWFHRHVRPDQWLLFEQNIEWTGDGRGLASGRFFDDEGRLVATCTQEGLVRWYD